jgi:hypothetical protein
MKLLIMQSSPISRHLNLVGTQYLGIFVTFLSYSESNTGISALKFATRTSFKILSSHSTFRKLSSFCSKVKDLHTEFCLVYLSVSYSNGVVSAAVDI